MKIKYRLCLEEPSIILDRLRGLHPFYSYSCIKIKEHIKPEVILDVGANQGDFIDVFKKHFPKAKIISFEPAKEFREILEGKASTHYPIGLSDENVTKTFRYKNDEIGQGSFLKGGLKCPIEERQVEVKRFDSLPIILKGSSVLLKLDVEGYELKVLKGFGEKLKEIDGVMLEYNRDNNWEGQPTIKELAEVLDKHGLSKMKFLIQDNGGTDLFFYREKEGGEEHYAIWKKQ